MGFKVLGNVNCARNHLFLYIVGTFVTMKSATFIQQLGTTESFAILDRELSLEKYARLDLSHDNPELAGLEISDPEICQAYIESVLRKSGRSVAFGGYLEKRNLYDSPRFIQRASYLRDIHLGMDFWAPAGTAIRVPLSGTLHSYANNAGPGNYGPTIVLRHDMENISFHTLYGHLALESLSGLSPGTPFERGDILAVLGSPEVNGGYAPHLHFQIILDLQGMSGDYPGVCAEHEVDFFRTNCPDPNILLNL